jgi:pilus assembly protein Flp/PilA
VPADLIHYAGDVIMLYAPQEAGQGILEYALILILVAVVVMLMIYIFGPSVGNLYSNILSNL